MKKMFIYLTVSVILMTTALLCACRPNNSNNNKIDDTEAIGEYGTPILSFGVFSDIHFHSVGDTDVKANYPKALKDLMKITDNKLSAVVVPGDFTEGYTEDYDTLINYTAEGVGDIPLIASYGNHEGDNKHAQYEQKFGKPIDNVTVVNGYNFICIGAHAKNTYTAKQAEWLDAQLTRMANAYPNDPVFVLIHHPVKGTHDAFTQENGNPELQEVLNKHKQAFVICAHQHQPFTEASFWKGSYLSYRSPNFRFDTEWENKDPNLFPAESEYALFRLTDKNYIVITKYAIKTGDDKPSPMAERGVNEYGIDGRDIIVDLDEFYSDEGY